MPHKHLKYMCSLRPFQSDGNALFLVTAMPPCTFNSNVDRRLSTDSTEVLGTFYARHPTHPGSRMVWWRCIRSQVSVIASSRPSHRTSTMVGFRRQRIRSIWMVEMSGRRLQAGRTMLAMQVRMSWVQLKRLLSVNNEQSSQVFTSPRYAGELDECESSLGIG